MNEQLYPLKFKTIFKDKIWGGEKINTHLGKNFSPLRNCGETWEISGVASDVSIVSNGVLWGKSLVEIIALYKDVLLGKSVYKRFGNSFPLLIKFIDANEDLSIQVHPNDVLAKKRHNSFGKTEMWYVIQADEGAGLISGFNQVVDKETYLTKFNSGHLTDILNKEKVAAGDVFFLPAGRVHTIGKGLLIAEIQQTSDITYRIYDFDRVDNEGNKRELHVEEALDAIDFKHYDTYKTNYIPLQNIPVKLVKCHYFTTNLLDYTQQPVFRDYAALDSFVIHICLAGAYTLKYENEEIDVKMGECVLIPATFKNIEITSNKGFKLLECYIEE